MASEDIDTYIQKSREEAERASSGVRDFRVFDFNYIPEKPLIRSEARRIIDLLVRYQQTGIPRNLAVIGARGCGKTLMLKYLAKTFSAKLQLPFRGANCRVHNTSFKLLADLLKVRPRGYSYSELCDRFEKDIPGKCVIVLDEVDLLSEKDFRKDVLYFLSRSPNRYCVVLLSNNPKYLNTLDESIRSSLQPDVIFFRNYSAPEIHDILRDRAAVGLKSTEDTILSQISALTARNTDSDIRVALKTLLHVVTHEAGSVDACFEKARQDIVSDQLSNLNDKALITLRAIMEEPTAFVKAVYQRYAEISKLMGEEPYSYVYFLNQLSYLQSVGIIMLVAAKVDRTYTNRIQPLITCDQLEPVLRTRFQ